MRFRQVTGHRQDCVALETVESGRWDSPWWIPGEVVNRDSIGRKNGGCCRWIVLRCNSAISHPCIAEALVAEDDILALVPSGDRRSAIAKTRLVPLASNKGR